MKDITTMSRSGRRNYLSALHRDMNKLKREAAPHRQRVRALDARIAKLQVQIAEVKSWL